MLPEQHEHWLPEAVFERAPPELELWGQHVAELARQQVPVVSEAQLAAKVSRQQAQVAVAPSEAADPPPPRSAPATKPNARGPLPLRPAILRSLMRPLKQCSVVLWKVSASSVVELFGGARATSRLTVRGLRTVIKVL